jgi:phosphatidate phosphatase LPIN
MKVGEAGEAFFVVETDEEVPEELQTSPVMSATEVSPAPLPISFSKTEDAGQKKKDELSATQQPFGEGQGDVSMDRTQEPLQAVSD